MAREASEEIARRDFCWKRRNPFDEPLQSLCLMCTSGEPDTSSLWAEAGPPPRPKKRKFKGRSCTPRCTVPHGARKLKLTASLLAVILLNGDLLAVSCGNSWLPPILVIKKSGLTWASLRHHFQGMDHGGMKQDHKRNGSFHVLPVLQGNRGLIHYSVQIHPQNKTNIYIFS